MKTCMFQLWKHLKHNITMVRVPKIIPVRLEKDNHERPGCADETHSLTAALTLFYDRLVLKGHGGGGGQEDPVFTKLDSIARKILASSHCYLFLRFLWVSFFNKNCIKVMLLFIDHTCGCCPLCRKMRDKHLC